MEKLYSRNLRNLKPRNSMKDSLQIEPRVGFSILVLLLVRNLHFLGVICIVPTNHGILPNSTTVSYKLHNALHSRSLHPHVLGNHYEIYNSITLLQQNVVGSSTLEIMLFFANHASCFYVALNIT